MLNSLMEHFKCISFHDNMCNHCDNAPEAYINILESFNYKIYI